MTFNKIFFNKRKVDTFFREHIMPSVRELEKERRCGRDIVLRRTTYNDYIDSLQKEGTITTQQAGSYIIPEDLVRDYKGY
jgi:hypothetical protein